LTEKALKREGFKLAEERYQELLPIITRLNELEEQQVQFEEAMESSSNKKKSHSPRR
jgi:hypothetical protein